MPIRIINVVSLTFGLATTPACTDEYAARHGCPEDGDCFFTAPQWEQIKTLTCLDCPPEQPMGILPASPGNEVADDPAARDLGEHIFEDENLGPFGYSCADCHDPKGWFTATLTYRKPTEDTDPDAEPGKQFRSITSVVDVAYYEWHMWHGRFDTLWEQAQGPIENGNLVGADRLESIHHVCENEEYGEEFVAKFGIDPQWVAALPERGSPLDDSWDELAPSQQARANEIRGFMGKALEAYMRTIVSGPTPFDQYVRGDENAIDESAKMGLELFIGKANCITCHSGPRFTDDDFHNIGLEIGPEGGDRKTSVIDLMGADSERFADLDPGDPTLEGALRTPTLRNVAMTGPYMHNYRFRGLDEVIWHYEAPPDPPPVGKLDPSMWSFDLTDEEVTYLEGFLHTLTSTQCPWVADGACPGPTN